MNVCVSISIHMCVCVFRISRNIFRITGKHSRFSHNMLTISHCPVRISGKILRIFSKLLRISHWLLTIFKLCRSGIHSILLTQI